MNECPIYIFLQSTLMTLAFTYLGQYMGLQIVWASFLVWLSL